MQITPAQRIQTVTEALKKMGGAMLQIGRIIAAVARLMRDIAFSKVASPREYHLYKYAKRARIRKKYRDRLFARLLEPI